MKMRKMIFAALLAAYALPTFADSTDLYLDNWLSKRTPLSRAPVLWDDGSAAAPIIARRGQPSTGLFFANGKVGLSTLGVERFAATANGVDISGGEIHEVRSVTAAGAVTVGPTDFHVCIRKTSGEATTVNLPATPALGQTYTVDDCKGDAAANHITVTPATGNIDGTSTYVITGSYDTWAGYYNGVIWKTVSTVAKGAILDLKRDFGAVCDGAADDIQAFQAAFDSHQLVYGPSATCRVTSEIVATTGTRFIGVGNYSGATGAEYTGATRILYDGPGGANSVVVRIAAAPVGTDTLINIQNLTFANVVVDGGGKAEFGVYMVRAWLNNKLDYITVTRTLKHAFWANRCWGGPIVGWGAIRNRGAGMSLGIDTFNWSTGFADAVDETKIDSVFAYFNGYDTDAASYMNAFDETTNADKEYGIGVGAARAMTFINAQTARNGGAGIYVSPNNLNGPVNFFGGYQELNGRSSGATRQWAIWDESSSSSWAVSFDGIYLGQTPAIRLTGAEPSRSEMGVEFRHMPFLGTIDADWDNYRLIKSSRSVVFTNQQPQYGWDVGAVEFVGNGGDSITDSGNLFWDDTNDRLGIGMNNPSVPLDVAGTIRATSFNAFNAATNTTADVSAPAGFFATYELRTGGTARWQIFKTNTGESGADAGSNLNFVAKTDAGATIDSPIALSRAAGGAITLGGTTSRPVTLADGSNFIFNTGTGTKFGTATTNKFAFWNVTPTMQPLATLDLGSVLCNIGLRACGTAYPITTSGAVNLTGLLTFNGSDVSITDPNWSIGSTGIAAGLGINLANNTLTASSVQLRTATTDENGTGAALYDGAVQPTFVGMILTDVARLRNYTVATLPACSANNYGFAAVSDATAPTYNGALTGGGSVKVSVFCDGVGWTSH